MPATDVVILSAARTPIGRYGGSFKDLHPAELGAVASRAAIERAGIAPADIDEVLMGHGRQAGSGPNPAHQVGHRAGVPHATLAQTINKACASGLQAIVSGAQSILLGESSIVLAGGIESIRLYRGAHRGHAAARAGAPQRAPRARDALRQRRHGDGPRHRADCVIGESGDWVID